MCVSAAVVAGAALVSSAVGAGTSIMANNANKKNAQWQNAMRQKELGERAKLAQLQAMQQENAKAEEYEINRSRQMAAMAAAQGFAGENISFFQGMDPEQQKQMGDTVRAVRLGLVADQSSIADQIKVSDFGARMTQYNSRLGNIAAGAKFVGDAANAASFYNNYGGPDGGKRVPKKGAPRAFIEEGS